MKKLVNESLEDILKPKSKSDLKSEFNKYPYLKNVYDVYEDLKKLGINVSLRSNMYNSKIKEIVADNYILSYLPEEERQIAYQKYGWGITPIEDGYLIIDNIDTNEAKKIFIDLINNGEKAEKKYLEKTYESVNESLKIPNFHKVTTNDLKHAIERIKELKNKEYDNKIYIEPRDSVIRAYRPGSIDYNHTYITRIILGTAYDSSWVDIRVLPEEEDKLIEYLNKLIKNDQFINENNNEKIIKKYPKIVYHGTSNPNINLENISIDRENRVFQQGRKTGSSHKDAYGFYCSSVCWTMGNKRDDKIVKIPAYDKENIEEHKGQQSAEQYARERSGEMLSKDNPVFIYKIELNDGAKIYDGVTARISKEDFEKFKNNGIQGLFSSKGSEFIILDKNIIKSIEKTYIATGYAGVLTLPNEDNTDDLKITTIEPVAKKLVVKRFKDLKYDLTKDNNGDWVVDYEDPNDDSGDSDLMANWDNNKSHSPAWRKVNKK